MGKPTQRLQRGWPVPACGGQCVLQRYGCSRLLVVMSSLRARCHTRKFDVALFSWQMVPRAYSIVLPPSGLRGFVPVVQNRCEGRAGPGVGAGAGAGGPWAGGRGGGAGAGAREHAYIYILYIYTYMYTFTCMYMYICIRRLSLCTYIWVVVRIMVPFWVPIIIRHLLFRA